MIETIPAKTIVTRTKTDAWFGAAYNMNIYRGCCHGCIYCDSRSECYGNADFSTVKAKENALSIIRRELAGKQRKGVVGTGSMSDPYNPLEKELKLTRQALALLAEFGFGVAIATKSPLVVRDMDVLQDIRRHAPVIIKITVTTPDESLSKTIEPKAPPSSERFAAIRALSAAGICCGILLMPVLPFITDDTAQLVRLVEMAAENGASFIYPGFGVTLRDVQREYFYNELDKNFPGLRRKYCQQFGTAYACGSPHAKQLQNAFVQACTAHGIHYKMRDIINAYQSPYRQEQVSLFDL